MPGLQGRLLDWFTIFIVPTILYTLYFIPKSWHDALVLNRDNPTLLGIIGNSYVHAAFWTHLIPNIVAYLPVAIAMYLLLISLDKRRLFYQVFLVNILVLPSVISLIDLYVAISLPSLPPNSLGFSGVDASLMGGLLIAVMLVGSHVFGFDVWYAGITLVSFMAILFTFQYGYALGTTEFLLAAPILVIFVFFLIVTMRSGKVERLKTGKPVTPAIKVTFMVIPLGILLLFTAFFYPQTIIINDSEVNVFVHYAGVLLGIIIAAFLGRRSLRPLSQTPPSQLAQG